MLALAKEAGDLALSYTLTGGAEAWNKTGGKGPVTEADLAVNRLCLKQLQTARPDYGWLSEETLDDPAARAKSRVWVVDPIDGTRAYISGDPHWCIALAIVEEGEAVASVLYAPALSRMYSARKGAGAFLNGNAIHVSLRDAEDGLRLITNEGLVTHPAWKEPWPRVEIARPKPNATLLRMAHVATGEWDAALVLAEKSDWDLAAGTVLVHEAGGHATTHLGEAFVFNQAVPAQRSVLASGKALHPLLLRRLEVVKIPDPQARAAQPMPDQTKPVQTEPKRMSESAKTGKQLLHIVFGGELKDVTGVEFEDLSQMDFIGAFPNYQEAYDAWKSAAQRTVDQAEMRYFILHAHKLLDPATGDHHHV
ncbi:inositol monophosphatase family protein [Hyphomonas neptunium ATCC 15444]|uniref:Inositol monophosphatase family protein n=2 Tax=Hyphomonas TaxID=85 RepID=Q0C2G1_HYPNA|nr:inositol monophosphatase family protein [Hyphomonas neptunium ATCC 15444]